MTTYQSGPCVDSTPHQREGEIHSKSTILRVAAVENPVIIRTNGRLDDENWIDWSVHMVLILSFCGVDGYAKGEIAQPNSDDDPEGAKNWAFNDTYAKLLIIINLTSTQVVYTTGCKTAHSMWANLEAVHEPIDNRFFLYFQLGELFHTRADDETNIYEHLNKLKRQQERINRMNSDKISDLRFKFIIMSSLPPSWNKFIDLVTGDANRESWESMSSPQLIGIIRHEYFRRSRRQELIE
jgi:hypothetical protein